MAKVNTAHCEQCGRPWSEHGYGLVHQGGYPKVIPFTICPEENR